MIFIDIYMNKKYHALATCIIAQIFNIIKELFLFSKVN